MMQCSFYSEPSFDFSLMLVLAQDGMILLSKSHVQFVSTQNPEHYSFDRLKKRRGEERK